jgi:hypothetical protein
MGSAATVIHSTALHLLLQKTLSAPCLKYGVLLHPASKDFNSSSNKFNDSSDFLVVSKGRLEVAV